MSTATPTRPPRAPHRLPRAALSRRERAGEVLRGSSALLVLLAVLVGVPFALVALVGNPLPGTPPTRAWLDAELSASAVLDVLAAVLWLVWAHFVVCVLTEARAWAVGGGTGRVTGGASQVLAQRLVAAVLLLAVGAVWVPSTVPVLDAVPVSSSPAPTAGAEAGAARTAARDTPGTPVPAGTPELGWNAQRGTDPVVHVVQPPQGRHHDCLWDIAGRTLGDPLRYHEIFELNKDRVQPDGARLVDADLIRPGWTLLLPADAQGTTSPAPAAAAGPAVPGTPTT